jgi:hypothetical protein
MKTIKLHVQIFRNYSLNENVSENNDKSQRKMREKNLRNGKALKEWKRRDSQKESVTFTGSRTLFGKEDLRGTLSHQTSTLRGRRACFSHRLRF